MIHATRVEKKGNVEEATSNLQNPNPNPNRNPDPKSSRAKTNLDVLHRGVHEKLHRHAPPPARGHAGAQVQTHYKPVLLVREPQHGLRRHLQHGTPPSRRRRRRRNAAASPAPVSPTATAATGPFGRRGRVVAATTAIVPQKPRRGCGRGCSHRSPRSRLRCRRRGRLIRRGQQWQGAPATPAAADRNIGVQ